jgi:hypothetical protein
MRRVGLNSANEKKAQFCKKIPIKKTEFFIGISYPLGMIEFQRRLKEICKGLRNNTGGWYASGLIHPALFLKS